MKSILEVWGRKKVENLKTFYQKPAKLQKNQNNNP
jgi:hypothetical protein